MKRLVLVCCILVLTTACVRRPDVTMEAQLKEKAMNIVDDVVHGEYQNVIDQSSLTIKYDITAEYLKESLEVFPDIYGSFVSIDSCDVTIRQDMYFVTVYVSYEYYKHVYQIAFNSNLNMLAIYLK